MLVVQRDEQPADALDDEHVGARGRAARAAATSASSGDRRARELGGEVRRDGGRRRSARVTSSGRAPVTAASSTVVGRRGHAAPCGPEAAAVAGCDARRPTGLNAATRSPDARDRRAQRRGEDVLPAPVSVPVTKQPRTRHALRPRTRRGARYAARRRLGVERARSARCRAPRRRTARRARPATCDRLVRGRDRHRRRGPEAGLQRRAAEHPRGLAQLVLRVRRHDREPQPRRARRARSAGGSPARRRRARAPPRRRASPSRRRRR